MAIKYTEEQLNNVDKSFLVQMFLNQQEEMAKATNQVELLTNEVQSLNKKMQTLMEQLVLSKKARFGQSSEKMEDAAKISFMEVNGTIVFFNEAEAVCDLSADEPEDLEPKPRGKKTSGKKDADMSGLPVNRINHYMTVRIFLSLENEDPFIIVKNSTEAEYRAFIEETLEDEMIFTKIEINKTLADGHFSIYRYQKFVEDIVGLSMEDVLKTFSMFLDGAGKNIVFELFDSPNIFYTKTMYFLPVGNREIDCNFSRTQRLLACRDNTYFYNQDSYGLLPDDFKIEVGYEGNPFKELFMKLETILAASFIASNTIGIIT